MAAGVETTEIRDMTVAVGGMLLSNEVVHQCSLIVVEEGGIRVYHPELSGQLEHVVAIACLVQESA